MHDITSTHDLVRYHIDAQSHVSIRLINQLAHVWPSMRVNGDGLGLDTTCGRDSPIGLDTTREAVVEHVGSDELIVVRVVEERNWLPRLWVHT